MPFSSAEAVFREAVDKAGMSGKVEVDSAGIIGYHAGRGRSSNEAACVSTGYRLTSISRPVIAEDFNRFDLIVGMDDRNIRTLPARLRRMAGPRSGK